MGIIMSCKQAWHQRMQHHAPLWFSYGLSNKTRAVNVAALVLVGHTGIFSIEPTHCQPCQSWSSDCWLGLFSNGYQNVRTKYIKLSHFYLIYLFIYLSILFLYIYAVSYFIIYHMTLNKPVSVIGKAVNISL